MTALMTTLIIVHVVISVALIVVVLLQQSKQQNISGAIMGGSSDTFFGKNKGRTVDAMLRKLTSVLAALFIVSSVTLAIVSLQNYKNEQSSTMDAETLPIESTEVPVDNAEAGAETTDVEAGDNANADVQSEDTTPAE